MYNTQEINLDLDRDYLPSLHSKRFNGDSQALLEHFVELITQQTKELVSKHCFKVQSNLRYAGTDDRQLVDVYYKDGDIVTKPSPLFVFIHGGYWQLLDKSSAGSMVAPLVCRGFRVAVMDYNLCPQVTLEEIVAQFAKFLQWIFEYAVQSSTTEISFAGHSAGAHLLTQLLQSSSLTTPEQRKLVRAVFLISGVYDLRELWSLPSVNPNDVLRLNSTNAAKLSPMLSEYCNNKTWSSTRLHVLVAAHDSVTFIEQSRSFSQILEKAGFSVEFKIFSDYDHFNIIEEAAIDDSAICSYVKQALQCASF